MSNSEKNIRSKLEQFEPQVVPSMAEIKRLNEGLDLLAGKSWFKKYWWVILLLLFLFTNSWLLIRSQKQNEILVQEFKRKLNEDLKTNDAIKSTEFQSLNDTILSIKKQLTELKNQNKKLISSIENSNTASFYDRDFLVKKYEDLTKTLKSLQASALASNPKFVTKNPKEEALISSIEIDKKENEYSNANKELKPKKIGFDTTAIDSFTKDYISKVVKEHSEKLKSEDDVVENPIIRNWYLGTALETGIQNTYFVDARNPFTYSLFGGMQMNGFDLSAGLAYRFLSYSDVSTQSLKAEIDEIGDVPQEISEDANELYSTSNSFLLPLSVAYNFGNSPFTGSFGTSLHLYTNQNFKIEGEHKDITLHKTHPEIQFFNYRLGLGYNYSVGTNMQLRFESGFAFGNPNFDLLLRERTGVYIKLNLLYL